MCFSSFLCRLTDTQESLESSLIEKENTLAQTSEKLELISSLRETLSQKEIQIKELCEKLLQTEHSVRVAASLSLQEATLLSFQHSCLHLLLQLEAVTKRCSSAEKQCSELRTEAADLLQKQSVLKEKVGPSNLYIRLPSYRPVQSLQLHHFKPGNPEKRFIYSDGTLETWSPLTSQSWSLEIEPSSLTIYVDKLLSAAQLTG